MLLPGHYSLIRLERHTFDNYSQRSLKTTAGGGVGRRITTSMSISDESMSRPENSRHQSVRQASNLFLNNLLGVYETSKRVGRYFYSYRLLLAGFIGLFGLGRIT